MPDPRSARARSHLAPPRRPRADPAARAAAAGPAAVAAALTVVATLLLALVAAAPAAAARKGERGTIGGTVTGKADGEPVAGARITLTGEDGAAEEGAAESATTDRKGRFSMKVAAGVYVIAVEAEGYAKFEARLPVAAGGGQAVTVELLDASAGSRSEAVQAYNAGGDALKAGDMATAKASFLAAVEADPTLPEPYQVLAGIYYEEGAWAEAAEAAEAFLAARPGDSQAQRTAYEAHRKLGNAERVAELRAALGADPELAETLAVHAFNEGATASQAGDEATARARFEEALALDGSLAAAHFGLATLEFEAERHEAALAAAEAGLALEPDSAQGRRLVFLVREIQGDDDAVAAAVAAYAEVDPDAVGDIFFRRGEAAFKNGEYAPAIAALGTAIEHRPEHAHAHRLLGLSHAASDAGKAKEHLRRFLELAPDDPEAATVEEILANL